MKNSLIILSLFFSFKLVAQDDSPWDSTDMYANVDVLRAANFYLVDKAVDVEGSLYLYPFKRFGIKLGMSYTQKYTDGPWLLDEYHIHTSGLAYKIGLLVASKSKAFHVELNYCYTNFIEKSEYIIKGPYWGDLIIPETYTYGYSYWEFYFSQQIYSYKNVCFNIGAGNEIIGISNNEKPEHHPSYIPGYGSYNIVQFFVLGTIGYKLN